MVVKIQRNLLERKKLESESTDGAEKKDKRNQQTQSFSKTLTLNQFSIGEAFLDGCHQYSMGDYQPIEHQNLSLRKSTYVKPRVTRTTDQILFKRYKSQVTNKLEHRSQLLQKKSAPKTKKMGKMHYKP